MKCLRMTRGASRFHSAQSHEPHECLWREPMPGPLGRETRHQPAHFRLGYTLRDWNEEIRMAEIAVVLGNFEFQNATVAERIPGQFGDHAMVLVPIVSLMSENQVGRSLRFELLEERLDIGGHIGEETVTKRQNADFLLGRPPEKAPSAHERLNPPSATAREHDPATFHIRPHRKQRENGRTATDFYVIRVRAEQEYSWSAVRGRMQQESRRSGFLAGGLPHRVGPSIAVRQTCHVARPLTYSSSSCCLSLNVSMAPKNPSKEWPRSMRSAIRRANGCSTSSSPA